MKKPGIAGSTDLIFQWVARMVVAVLVKIFVTLTKLTVHPEAPLSFITACQNNAPTAAIIHFDRVLMVSRAKAD